MFVEKANNHENKIQNGRYQVTYDFTIVKWKTADLKKKRIRWARYHSSLNLLNQSGNTIEILEAMGR